METDVLDRRNLSKQEEVASRSCMKALSKNSAQGQVSCHGLDAVYLSQTPLTLKEISRGNGLLRWLPKHVRHPNRSIAANRLPSPRLAIGLLLVYIYMYAYMYMQYQ